MKPAKKAPAKTGKVAAKASRPAKAKATKSAAAMATTTDAPTEVANNNNKSGLSEKEKEKENTNTEEAVAAATVINLTASDVPVPKGVKRTAGGASASTSRKPLSGITPLPQPTADPNIASGSNPNPRKQVRMPKTTVAAPPKRIYNFRGRKATEEIVEEGPKPKRTRY